MIRHNSETHSQLEQLRQEQHRQLLALLFLQAVTRAPALARPSLVLQLLPALSDGLLWGDVLA